jgi:hypothetical protein
MSRSAMALVPGHKIVHRHSPEHDDSLFRASRAERIRNRFLEFTLQTTSSDLYAHLHSLVALGHQEAIKEGSWRYPSDDPDVKRVFTPWFGMRMKRRGGEKVPVDSRLHIKPAYDRLGSTAPSDSSIHIEKRMIWADREGFTAEDIFEGPRIGWEWNSDYAVIRAEIDIEGGEHVADIFDNKDPYAVDALSTLRIAHNILIASRTEENYHPF